MCIYVCNVHAQQLCIYQYYYLYQYYVYMCIYQYYNVYCIHIYLVLQRIFTLFGYFLKTRYPDNNFSGWIFEEKSRDCN